MFPLAIVYQKYFFDVIFVVNILFLFFSKCFWMKYFGLYCTCRSVGTWISSFGSNNFAPDSESFITMQFSASIKAPALTRVVQKAFLEQTNSFFFHTISFFSSSLISFASLRQFCKTEVKVYIFNSMWYLYFYLIFLYDILPSLYPSIHFKCILPSIDL